MLNVISARSVMEHPWLKSSRPRHVSELVMCFQGQTPEKRDRLGKQKDPLPAEMWRSTQITREVWRVNKFSASDR